MKIKVSTATASVLGLKNYKIDAIPTTLYFLLPFSCKGSCGYCYLRRGYLARVRWPSFEFEKVKKKIRKDIARRICIQTTYNEKTIPALLNIIPEFDSIPVSASINPVSIEEMKMLKEAGLERVGFGIDACSEKIFNKWKHGVPSWKEYIDALKNARRIFGNATAHLIIGLGESDREAVNIMKFFSQHNIDIALFAYTKNGESMVSLPRYRTLQIVRHFIKSARILFDGDKIDEVSIPYIEGRAFMTSGCPDCNRPFYNERVTKIYNYPYEIDKLTVQKSIKEAKKYARIYIASGEG